jgi:tetratricopeptide (TPR) repeat protein
MFASAFGSALPAAAPPNPAFEPRCQQVADRGPFRFRGRTLEETPDITAAELRRANALLSSGCRMESVALLEAYRRAHPGDFRTAYLDARLSLTGGDTVGTEQLLAATLRDHPDFQSAQLLLASVYIEQNRIAEARALLESLSLHAPTSLWVFMDGLRLEALESPSAALRDELLEINRSPAFPPSARQAASWIGRRLPNLSREQYEAFHWAELEYESAMPMACKIQSLAFNLVVVDGRYADAKKLLESPKALAADCAGVEGNRILLAEIYLFEAARISAAPSAANAALVSKAHEVLGGDWSGLSRFIMGRPQFATIAPFIASAMAPADVDAYGHTQICNAVMMASAEAVRAQLELGADPNGRCERRSLLGFLAHGASDEPTRGAWQQNIVRMLRAAGGRVTPEDLEYCRNPENGPACRASLLPLLER